MSPRSTADPRVLELRPAHELVAEVRPEPVLGVALERPELDDREQASAAPDPLAAVQDGKAGARRDDRGDDEPEGEHDHAEADREYDVEETQLEVDPALRRGARELLESRDERLGWPRRRRHVLMLFRFARLPR